LLPVIPCGVIRFLIWLTGRSGHQPLRLVEDKATNVPVQSNIN
jgi:hypothetical protein